MSTLNHNNQNNNPVGFFDSGVGGLSVYARFRELMPSENVIYYGDLAHLPYGNKSQTELIGYAREILNFYKTKSVKAVVIACNTSSAQAYETIKDEYGFKIYPIIQSCAKVIAEMNINRVGVFATDATCKSRAYTRELMKYRTDLSVMELACPNWVNIVENGLYDDTNSVLNIKSHVLEMMRFEPDKIILGCTHYPYLLPILEKFAPKEIFIDPAEIFVEYIKQDLGNLASKQDTIGNEEFFVSSRPEAFIKNAEIFYEVKKMPLIPLNSAISL